MKIAVSQFDACGRNYLAQLACRVAMTPKRKKAVERILFHDLDRTAKSLESFFDIKLFLGIHQPDRQFLNLMFQRRHVYEHNAGVADEKYMARSGDTSVVVGQAIRETESNAQRLGDLVIQMAINLYRGFHDIFTARRDRRRDLRGEDALAANRIEMTKWELCRGPRGLDSDPEPA